MDVVIFFIFLIVYDIIESNIEAQFFNLLLDCLLLFKVRKYIHPTLNWNFSVLLEKYFKFLHAMFQSGAQSFILNTVQSGTE